MYDTEEEQVEALKRWWQENGTSAIVGLSCWHSRYPGLELLAGS